MARQDITSSQINQMSSRGVVTPVTVAAHVDGHAFVNDGKTMVTFENTNAATRTVTAKVPAVVDVNLDVPDRQITLPATTGRGQLGPFGPEYTQPDGKVHIDFSADAGVVCTYWRLP
ncbi:hypothetical protein [Thermomonospora cellulosilytica]|uniref:3-oxoacyl-ACP reductase-like protein n=1 Tax=Thermomonospora cellulosilytica TaxID=1411118 RepID=A0A7W3R8J6_9ACTN|nr:hypothetical protein [Thermomonospora cellulosilytica]MBA9003737.1 3-oxoacyl-ACP reductase-like protein [Thermomonospora cellulosilytica]